ncbi:LpqB family beta-propeller domain-containing protein [Nonomuraea antimicrobica]
MTRTRRLAAVGAIALALAWTGSGCTVIVSGPNTVSDEGGGDPLTKPFQRMIAIPPQKTWGPNETIRGLQAAMAVYADDPSILPQYLTPAARAKWTAEGPVTVLEDQYEVVPPPPREDAETSLKAVLKGRWVARINEDDAYKPTTGKWEKTYELVKTPQGGYLVNDLPPGLLLTNADVLRSYRPTDLYYLNRGTRSRLVVDRVRLRLKTSESFAQTVLERLLKPPTEALRGAVTTSLPPSTKIESIGSSEERVVINLSGLLDRSAEDALSAQIRHSLNMNEIAKGRVIEVQLDGEEFTTDRPDAVDEWLDDSGDTAYYVNKGAVHYLGKDGPAGVVAGAAGEQRGGYSDFAVSKEHNGGEALVAARTSTGISVAWLRHDGRWQEVIPGTDLTPPTWHRDGSLWTYDRKKAALLRYDPVRGPALERIQAPNLADLDVTRLRIARDGVRVVVTTGKNTVQIGALIGEGTATTLGNFQLLTTTEVGDEIVDIAWGDDEHLLVLEESKAGQILNEINVGDGETTGVPLKDRLKSVAAVDGRILAESEGGTKVWELDQDRQTWTAKIEPEAGQPIFPLG